MFSSRHSIGSPPPESRHSGTGLAGLRGPVSLVEKIATAQHFEPPSPRELRAQAVQRLQVGLFGLAAMLLLVGLANIIMQHAREANPTTLGGKVTPGVPGGLPGNADPLVDMVVAPSPEAAAVQSASPR